MRILILYSATTPGIEPGRLAEFDLSEAAAAVAQALPGAILHATPGTPHDVLAAIFRHAPNVVFNACEAPSGRPDLEAHVAALLEWSGLRFTGNGSETLSLCRRKDRVNAVLTAAGIAIPPADGFPCIVKPADQDGSVGIDGTSVCQNDAEAKAARARLPGRSITQRFLPGREFAVSLWGQAAPAHSSIAEFRFAKGLRLNTYRSKWAVDTPDFANAQLDYHGALDPQLRQALLDTAEAAWHAVEARGYMRIDFRLDADGRPCVLDVNPNPDIGPGGGIHRAAEEAGWTWPRFVRQQIAWA